MRSTTESDVQLPDLAEPSRTKSQIRIHHPKPTIEETVERYAARTGRKGPENLDWLMAYNLFRLAAICQGIAGRVRDGTAASAHAVETAKQVVPLAKAAMMFGIKAGA